jgi:hypothetical protein
MIVGVLHLVEVFSFGVGISQGFLFGLVVSFGTKCSWERASRCRGGGVSYPGVECSLSLR